MITITTYRLFIALTYDTRVSQNLESTAGLLA